MKRQTAGRDNETRAREGEKEEGESGEKTKTTTAVAAIGGLGRGAFLGDDALLQNVPEFQGWPRDTPRLLRSEQDGLLGHDTATTGRDRVGLLVYERGEGGLHCQ